MRGADTSIRASADGVLWTIRVQPGAKKPSLRRMADGVWRVAVAAPAVDGKANDALCGYVAKLLGIPRSAVDVKSGETSRHKTLAIRGVGEDRLSAALGREGRV